MLQVRQRRGITGDNLQQYITSPVLPELITEGDTIAEALADVEDALIAIIEAYEDLNCPYRLCWSA